MKKDINWYMNQAKKLNNISSDRNLARELEVSSVGFWRDPYRPRIPEQAVMIKLAKLANIPEEIALIDRDIWIAEFKAPETVPFYKNIKKALTSLQNTAATFIIAMLISLSGIDFDDAATSPADSAGTPEQYILW